ncbi:class I glutamine amidotransferase-like protein [Westerdykella ornata]|uniref:Class I glutamine amidotransferase-like protein n=1 Tax=Westerdykella ornata TaxID=318751 RepID=A0A6A6JAK4_WESOR|nr:class I glutamine amidotransferase-like protein [Westerdykella ornata]KAF2273264.1 class I glutamine amidotransferase-like protein [Westerdykella ornata]
MRFSKILAPLMALPSVLALPEAPKNVTSVGKPLHYAMMVFPGFQALDVYGPLDVIGSQVLMLNQPLHLSILSRTLAPVTTVPQKSPTMNMTHGNFGTQIMPTTTFKKVLAGKKDKEKGDIDVLLVPGGAATRGDMTEEIEFVKTMYPKVKYVLSICTGATILARAGILDGRNATTNKRAWAWATSTGPRVNWIPTARWVDAGNIWTSSGVSAGIDLTFAFVEHLYGKEVADYTSINLEYPRWPGGPSNDPFAAVWELEKVGVATATVTGRLVECSLSLGL